MKFFEVLSTQPGTTTTPQAAPAIGAATGAGAGMMAGNQPVTPADKAKQQRRDALQKQIDVLKTQLDRLMAQQANIK